MIEWHHRLNGHGFEHVLEDSKGQGNLACCIPWGHKELMRLNNYEVNSFLYGKTGQNPRVELKDYRYLKNQLPPNFLKIRM